MSVETIRVTRDVYTRLMMIVHQQERQVERRLSFDDAIDYLLDYEGSTGIEETETVVHEPGYEPVESIDE